MDELKKINKKVKMKQIMRLVGGIGSIVFGMTTLGMYMYQAGITRDQKAIHDEFPEEYVSITNKIIESFEK